MDWAKSILYIPPTYIYPLMLKCTNRQQFVRNFQKCRFIFITKYTSGFITMKYIRYYFRGRVDPCTSFLISTVHTKRIMEQLVVQRITVLWEPLPQPLVWRGLQYTTISTICSKMFTNCNYLRGGVQRFCSLISKNLEEKEDKCWNWDASILDLGC